MANLILSIDCTCVALNISSLHLAFIYTLPQTCSYQQLWNWITVIIDINSIWSIGFFKSVCHRLVSDSFVILLLCVSYTTTMAQIFMCSWQDSRWTALCHMLNPPSVATSFHIVQGTGHSSTTRQEKQTPKQLVWLLEQRLFYIYLFFNKIQNRHVIGNCTISSG